MKEFPRSIFKDLDYYVYIYIDPRDDKIFYVGKGNGNRAFSHLNDESESDKVKKIKDIRDAGFEPEIEILVHGLTDEISKKIEASIIDLIGINNITNLQRGYESKYYGRMSCQQLVSLYNSAEAEIDVPALLITINKTFYHGMSSVELYDSTRSAWTLGIDREKAEYAFAVYEGIVQEVYKIEGWFKDNKTFNSKKTGRKIPDSANSQRWEFVGNIADEIIRNKYRYKNVSKYLGPRNPVNYVNIKKSELC